MKKRLLLAALLLSLFAKSQDSTSTPKDTSWKTSGLFGLNFSSTSLSNWAGGGQNNIALNSIINYQAIYQKGNHFWESKLDAQFGVIKNNNAPTFKKNLDQFFLLTKYNLKTSKKYWFYSGQADYRTQFAPAYVYSGDERDTTQRATSDFNSPGYVQIALGLDYKPTSYLSVNFAPLAGKITMVNRQYLADEGAFGVTKAVIDDQGVIVTPGQKVRFEFGGRIIVKFKKQIAKNTTLDSYLDLFSNYANNPGNIDVMFNNLLSIKLNKFFSITLLSQMLYDDDVITKRDWDKDGLYDKPEDISGPRLQLLTTFAIGLSIKLK